MTKKHFIKIAKAIREYEERNQRLKDLVDSLCIIFKDANPRFDKKRFVDAINMNNA